MILLWRNSHMNHHADRVSNDISPQWATHSHSLLLALWNGLSDKARRPFRGRASEPPSSTVHSSEDRMVIIDEDVRGLIALPQFTPFDG